MCQLTLYNFHEDFDINDKEVKKALINLLYITSVENAREHGDGHGVAVFNTKTKKDVVIKTKRNGITGDAIVQLDKLNIPLGNQIIFHVRKASVKYKADDLLDANAHPFEGENFILAHNGTLTGKHITAETSKTKIDSAIFHEQLEKNWTEAEKDDTMLSVLQKTYDDFAGKMALLFKHKKTGKVYAVRNTRADLHKTDIFYKGKVVGYVINTEEMPFYLINNLAIRFSGFTFDLSEDPKNIETLALFEVQDKDLLKLGDIKNTVTTHTTTTHNRNYAARERRKSGVTSAGIKLDWLVNDFIDTTRLSIPEVNLLFTLYGYPLPYIKNKEDYERGEKKIKELFGKHYRKEKKLIVEEIMKAGVSLQEFHQTFQFPYFILSTKELTAIKEEIVNG